LVVTAVCYILGKAVPVRAMKAYGRHGTTAPHILKRRTKAMPKDSNIEAVISLCSLQNFGNNTTGQTFRNKQEKKKTPKIKQ